MSDLSDAVFGGQLMGHVIAVEELTASIINDAVIKADLASSLIPNDGELDSIEQSILEAKTAQHITQDGNYEISNILTDHIDAELASDSSSIFL